MGHAQEKLAFDIERPSTLDEALNVIDGLSGSYATLSTQVGTFAAGRTTCSECGDFIERDDNDGPLFYEVDRLVNVRRAIKRGDTSEAIYQLEKVLSGLDSAWMTRA